MKLNFWTSRKVKNRILKYKYFLIAFIVGLIGVFTYPYFTGEEYQQRHGIVRNETPQNNNAIGSQNSNTNTLGSETPAPTTKPMTLDSKFEIPIMMYHYIRDFDDPNDSIGTNLSVPQLKFASQLDLIKSKGYTTITFEDIKNGNIPEKPIILTFDDGYKDFYTNAFPELKKRNMKAVSYVISDKIDNGMYMSQSEIKEVSSYGIEIGSHTISHPDLAKSSNANAQREITDSKSKLESIMGKSVISFCYPAGKYNQDVVNLVQKAGYTYAVTTNGGISKISNPFELNRYRMNHDTSISTYLK